MKTARIAMYLAGKFPPYYRAPFDKLEFLEIIRAKSKSGFTEDFFKVINSQDFYSICLNRVKKANEYEFTKVIEALELNDNIF